MQVYFKLLYSRSPEVADAVSKCLKAMLTDLGKLPKELLQSALKPVLLNLAEAKSLSVGNLGGLGRLLELLSSYFKVEIGIKLLVHFRTLSSDVGALTRSALNPQDDRGELPVMYALVDIFRLLPFPGSEQFLLELVPLVIDTETMLKKDGPTPFTTPLAGYLNRYPAETIKFFQRRLEDDVGAARTFMAVMDNSAAAELREFLSQPENTDQLMRILLGPDPRRAPAAAAGGDGGSEAAVTGELPPWRGALHAAQLIRILVKHDEDWLMDHRKPVVQNMINRWISKARRDRLLSKGQAHLDQLAEDDVTLEVWFAYLELAQNPSESDFEPIDLVFHIVDVFVWSSPTDRTAASAFLFRHVIATKNVGLKKRILARFFDIFTSTAVTAQHKTAALRHVINPMLMVAFSRGEAEKEIVDPVFITLVRGASPAMTLI